MLTLDESTFDAVIFDCDGTLADSMPAHYIAWVETLESFGVPLSEDEFYAMGGWPTKVVAETMLARTSLPADLEQVAIDKERRFLEKLSLITPITPVIELAKKYSGIRPIAVGTGGFPYVCHAILSEIGLPVATFDTIVTCEDVDRHKPHPDIFLEAARRLEVPPHRCIVFEDVDPGIEAARRAGMQWRDVRDFYRPRRVTSETQAI